MGRKNTKRYDPAFKARVALEAAREDESLAQIGQRHGVHPVLVGQWKKRLLERAAEAFTGLGAPHWRSDARGLISGMSLDTSRDDLIAATLASVAYQSADLLAALARDGVSVTCLRVDGGMVANDWLCQFLADVADVRVERPVITETTALGAGMLAALGGGLVGSLPEAAGLWRLQHGSDPAMSAPTREKLLRGWSHAVARTLGQAVG